MKIVQLPPKTECRQCGEMHEWDPCFYCLRRCRRKKSYERLDEAEAERRRMAPRPWDDPTLEAFVCHVTDKPHFHLGHTGGSRGQMLIRWAEDLKARRGA